MESFERYGTLATQEIVIFQTTNLAIQLLKIKSKSKIINIERPDISLTVYNRGGQAFYAKRQLFYQPVSDAP